MEDDDVTISVNGGIAELFYVVDFGDYLGSKFEGVLSKNGAQAIGHLTCWAFNLALWGAGLGLAARLVASYML